MRTRAVVVTLVAVGVLVSGCGSGTASGGSSAASSSSGTPDGSASSSAGRSPAGGDMSGMDMTQVDESSVPSATARMVCEESEIRDAVKRTFQMSAQPTSTHSWSKSDRVYSCRWAVPGGTLRLTVQDGDRARPGRAYFDQLRASLGGATTIKGMDNFGFPAFETRAGDVGFFKDGKTLHVDATGLPGSSLPKHFSRAEVAYSVASAVIACWTE